MSTTTTSPNMGLVVPTVGNDPDPDWANNLNADLSIVDSHNHSPGQGVQITPNGISINADLPFLSNNATGLRSVRFTAQSVPIANSGSDVGCLYVSGNEIYYNDVSGGHQVQITSGGSVNAGAGSITGLPSGTASATFSAGTFVWQSATATAANLDAGSIVIRNSGASAKGLTLQAPAAMAANITQTLPTIPASLSLMAMDTSGNMSAPYSISGGLSGTVLTAGSVTATQIASGTITTTQIASATIAQSNLAARATGTTVAAGGVAIATSSGTFTTTSATFQTVTNQSITITTTGRPVRLELMSASTSTSSFVGQTAGGYGMEFRFVRGGSTVIGLYSWSQSDPGSANPFLPSSACAIIDVVAAGTYTYIFQMRSTVGGGQVEARQVSLVAYEL